VRRSTYAIRLLSIAIVAIWFAWIVILLNQSGLPSVLSAPSDNSTTYFSRVGTFGDAFGVIGSLMATLAAMGAFYTFSEQREESRRNQFEQNFNTLFANFQSIVRQIDISVIAYDLPDEDIPEQYWDSYAKELYKMHGRDAIRHLLSILRERLFADNFADSKVVSRVYDEFFDRWMDDLGHYFRCLYHLMRLVS
jgi:hypothetical protein